MQFFWLELVADKVEVVNVCAVDSITVVCHSDETNTRIDIAGLFFTRSAGYLNIVERFFECVVDDLGYHHLAQFFGEVGIILGDFYAVEYAKCLQRIQCANPRKGGRTNNRFLLPVRDNPQRVRPLVLADMLCCQKMRSTTVELL